MANRGSGLTARIALPVLAAGALVVLAASQVFACTSLATLALTPSVAVAGTTVQAAAAEFSTTGSQIVFRWNSRSGSVLGAAPPDAKGDATITFVVPAVAPGNYVVIAQQTVTNIPQGGSAIATIQFTVPGAPSGGNISSSVDAQPRTNSVPAQSGSVQPVQPAPRDTTSAASPAMISAGEPAAAPDVAVAQPVPLTPTVDNQVGATPPHPGNGYRDEYGITGAVSQEVAAPPSHKSPVSTGTTISAGVLALLVTAGSLGMCATACGGALALRSRSASLRRAARRGHRST